jgi:glutathione S-transferase
VARATAASRASRSLLALEELGLPYRHAPLEPWSDTSTWPTATAARRRGRSIRATARSSLSGACGARRRSTRRPYLLGDDFTLADLNLAAMLSEPWEKRLVDGELDPADHGLTALADWLARCTGRASWERVRSLP